MLVADGLHEGVPLEVGKVDGSFDAKLLQDALAYDTHLGQSLTATVLYKDALVIDVVGALCEDEHAHGQANAAEDVHDVGLQLGKGHLLVGVRPASAHALTGNPQSHVRLFAISVQHVLDDFGVAA